MWLVSRSSVGTVCLLLAAAAAAVVDGDVRCRERKRKISDRVSFFFLSPPIRWQENPSHSRVGPALCTCVRRASLVSSYTFDDGMCVYRIHPILLTGTRCEGDEEGKSARGDVSCRVCLMDERADCL